MTIQANTIDRENTEGAASLSLAALVETSALSNEDALSLLRQLASALDDLHAQDRIHGALRPSLIEIDNSRSARIAGSIGAASTHQRAEALLHLAPEQLRSEPACAASDQFALGLIAYRIIVGRTAFAANGLAESLFLTEYGMLDQSADAFVDCATQAVFDRVLSVNPVHRFPSCLDFVEALKRIPRRSYSETRLLGSEDVSEDALADSTPALPEPRPRGSQFLWAAAALSSLLAFTLGVVNWRAQSELDSLQARTRQLARHAGPALQNGTLEVCNVSPQPLHIRELAAAYMDPSNHLRVFNSDQHTQDGWLIAPGQSSVLSWREGSDADWNGAVLFYFLHVEVNGRESVLAGRWNAAASGCLHL